MTTNTFSVYNNVFVVKTEELSSLKEFFIVQCNNHFWSVYNILEFNFPKLITLSIRYSLIVEKLFFRIYYFFNASNGLKSRLPDTI